MPAIGMGTWQTVAVPSTNASNVTDVGFSIEARCIFIGTNTPKSESDDLMTRGILGFVRRAPGLVVFATALLFYPGAGLLMPLGLHWSLFGLIVANVFGTVWAAVFAIGYLVVQVQDGHRRHLLEWTTNLRLLSAEEFEWIVAELFRREDWHVSEAGRQEGPDGNIDLELERKGERRIVQCKRWGSRRVPVSEVREFAGTLLREGLPGTAGIFVTLSTFGEQARAEAQKIGMAVVDGTELSKRIEKVRRSEPCPACAAPMVLSHSVHGWWFRCVVPGCQGKRNLGPAGRAAEFLTPAA